MTKLNKISVIEAKLDAMMNNVCMQKRSNRSAYLIRIVEDQQRVFNDEGLS